MRENNPSLSKNWYFIINLREKIHLIEKKKMEKLQWKIEELEEKVSSLKGQMFNKDVENSQAFAQRVEEMDALLKNIETLKQVFALRLSEEN